MFQQFKNIDSAFKYIRVIALSSILGSIILCLYSIYYTNRKLEEKDKRVLVVANGKIFEAVSNDRGNLWPIEIKDHVKMFHLYFYTLQPDEQVINKNIIKALYLADDIAKNEYDNLKESGYYTSLIAANISQEIEMDSIEVNMNASPWYFRYTGKLRIIRATTIVTRSLITEGSIRITQASDNNPHGLLIERWRIIENKDLNQISR
jgi:conjugative transposon TraK protein